MNFVDHVRTRYWLSTPPLVALGLILYFGINTTFVQWCAMLMLAIAAIETAVKIWLVLRG